MKDKNVSKTLEQWIKKLKCSGSSGIGLETFPDIRVGVDPSPVTEEAVIFPDIVRLYICGVEVSQMSLGRK